MMTEILARLRFLILRKKRSELEGELRFHLEQSIAAKMAEGLSAEEARRQALIEFGGVERTFDECERQRPGWWIGTVAQDVRYTLRGFRRNPLFTITVLATLALGIGSTTAVFSVVDRILFRGLPYANADRLVSVGLVHSLERQEFLMGRIYDDWQDNQKPFEALASQGTMPHACDLIENNPAQLNCQQFQAGFLPLLGISPMLGRNFLPEEDRPNGPRVVMISYGLWATHYDRDPRILDRAVNIDGNPAHVVGVLPRDFQFPTLQPADVIFPMALNRAEQQTVNGGYGWAMRSFAQLKPGVSIEQARAQMQPLYDAERAWFPAEIRDEIHLSIRSLRDRETVDARSIAWILFASALAVLLIACANVASLIMARGAVRDRELAVRSALGASRGRLIRQALTEAAMLSLAGAVLGLGLAQGLLLIFVALAPTGIPFLGDSHLDLRIALFTVLLSLVCGALFGLVPALKKPGALMLGSKASAPRNHALLRRSLVAGQIAISMILLSGAALLLRSFQKIEQQKLGMRPSGVLTAQIALPSFRYNTGQKEMDFYLRLEAALRRMPGVRAVGISDSVPPAAGGDFRFADLVVQGRPHAAPGTGGTVGGRNVTPDYFRALDIPIVRGRSFTERDRAATESLVVLSRLLATRLFPGEDPVGKRIGRVHDGTGQDATWSTVVGVADNVKNSGLTEDDAPEMYSLRRNVAEDWSGRRPVILIDSVLPANGVAPWVRSQIAALDLTVPVEIETLTKTISTLADRPRFETTLLGFFALTGLLMAVIGLYGVIAFMATQRTQEIGVRMALGATRVNILRLIASEGVRLIVIGGALGLGVALGTSRVLKSLLFQVGTHDPLIFTVVPVLLCLVAFVAILFPALSATRVDPAVALRNE